MTKTRLGSRAGERGARYGLVRNGREHAQHLAFAVGEMQNLVAAAQFVARIVEYERTEAHLLGRRCGRGLGPAQNARDPQRQLARLERLGDVIVGADLEAADAAFLFRPRGQHEDGHARGFADRFDEIEAAFARHHHVEDQKIEAQAGELGARIRGVVGRRDPIAFRIEITRQQIADAPIIVDDKEMRRVDG